MLHRAAGVRSGQSALVSGANGGVGTAALELFRVAGIRAIGAASPKHFDLVRELGAEPIASRDKPLDEGVLAILPEGVDAAFDNLGGARTREHVRATKRGGIVVGVGFMATGGSTLTTLRGFASLYAGARIADRRSTFYGITKLYKDDRRPFLEDLPKLFTLLAARTIRPKIAAVLPLLDGRRAQEMLERGNIVGKIVLARDNASSGV